MRTSLFTILSLTTILAACGGGGGGGGGGNGSGSTVPTTTLPTTASCSGTTCMTTASFSNSQRRAEIYNQAAAQVPDSSLASSSGLQTMGITTFGNEKVENAYAYLKEWLIDGGDLTGVDAKDLRMILLLAGFDNSMLPGNGHLKKWLQRNANMVKNKAQETYDMYGTVKDVSLENAKLTMVGNGDEQDTFVNFILDDQGNITGLHMDIDTDHANSRMIDSQKAAGSDNKFVKTGYDIVYGLRIGVKESSIYSTDCALVNLNPEGHSLELDFNELATSDEQLRKLLIAKLYEDKDHWKHHYTGTDEQFEADFETFAEQSTAWINTLTVADFTEANLNVTDHNVAFADGLNEQHTSTTTYESYAKNIGEHGLTYSDFGLIGINSNEGSAEVNEKFVFAGGYDVKRIRDTSTLNAQGEMNFEGNAVAALIYQKEDGGNGAAGRQEDSASYQGTAKLTFNNGNQKLVTNFNNWYDVEMNTGSSGDTLKFTNGDKITDSKFKFEGRDNSFTVENFTTPGIKEGAFGSGETYGTVDVGYYGDNNNPTEATGYVVYGEERPIDANHTSESLNMAIGFGAQ